MMDIQIRPMRIDDAPYVNMLSSQLGYPLQVPETGRQIKTILELKDNCAFVATCEEKITGWVHAFIANRIESKPFIEIGGLVVDEALRGKGIGRLLVQKIHSWCKDQGIQDLRVRSNTKRKDAHKFYTSLGFTENKEQKVFQIIVSG